MSHHARRRPERPAVIAPVTLHQFEALDRTHGDVVQSLRKLETLIDSLERTGVDAATSAAAAALCAFFDGTARQHHEDEERIVFPPLLTSSDAELVQNVERLQQDHGWLEEDWRELRPLLEGISEGQTWHDPNTLRQMCEVFSALYMEHIALEESLIYPASKQRLIAAEAAEHERSAAPT